MEVVMVKGPNGALLPLDDDESEKTKRWKAGSVVRGDFKLMRNGKFHKKMMSLFGLCYDQFKESLPTSTTDIEPSFDVFRKELTILSGHYQANYSIDGSVRLEAKSISFANCTEDEFEVIYSDVINAALKHVYQNSKSDKWLREMVEKIIQYA